MIFDLSYHLSTEVPYVLGLATSKLDTGRIGEQGRVDNEECDEGLDDLLSTR